MERVMANTRIPASTISRKSRPARGGCWRHGFSDSRLENSHIAMRQRCYNPKSVSYRNYGARGIAVCKRWIESPRSFYEWAVANGYRDDLFLDRKDNDGDYSPKNCRWVTKAQSESNKSTNRRIEYNGENLTIAEWTRKTGLPRTLIESRYDRNWPLDKVFSHERYSHRCRTREHSLAT
jgi:hypothetical protein